MFRVYVDLRVQDYEEFTDLLDDICDGDNMPSNAVYCEVNYPGRTEESGATVQFIKEDQPPEDTRLGLDNPRTIEDLCEAVARLNAGPSHQIGFSFTILGDPVPGNAILKLAEEGVPLRSRKVLLIERLGPRSDGAYGGLVTCCRGCVQVKKEALHNDAGPILRGMQWLLGAEED